MERLTRTEFEGTQCEPYVYGGIEHFGDSYGGEVVDRLSAYEDTNLTPEQITEIDRMYREQCRELDELKKKLMESSSHSEFDAHKTPIGKRLDAGLYD